MKKTVKDLDKENKKHMKEQRLEQYQRRYFELELDKAALSANNDLAGIAELEIRMNAIEVAYNAINELAITTQEELLNPVEEVVL